MAGNASEEDSADGWFRPRFGDALVEVFHGNPDGLLIAGQKGSILRANGAACALFNSSHKELLRLSLPDLADVTGPAWQAALAERSRTGSVRATLPMVRADRSPFLAEVMSVLFSDSDGTVMSVIRATDVTEQVRRQRRLAAYDEVAEALLARTAMADVLGLLARHARIIFDAAEAAMIIPDEAGSGFVIAAGDGAQMSELVGATYPPTTISRTVMATRRAVAVDHLTTAALSEEGRNLGLGPAMVMPITSDEHVLGAMWVGAPLGAHPYSAEDLREATQFAQRINIVLALGHAREEMERSQQLLAEQLRGALDSRIIIEQAKGIISAEHRISVELAFETLRRHARSRNANIHEVAAAVVNLGLRL